MNTATSSKAFTAIDPTAGVRPIPMGLHTGLPVGLHLCVGMSMALLGACGEPAAKTAERSSAPMHDAEVVHAVAGEASEPVIFEDVTASSGLDFVHFNGMSGGFYFAEMMGSGGALLDADEDGDLDLYLVQGAELGGVAAARSLRPPLERMLPLRDRLYLQDGSPGAGVPHFRDATDESGLDVRGYGMGAVSADWNGDGHADLYVTQLGPNELWLGRGDGTFARADDEASRVPDWSVAAVPLDADSDGDLDLFVANYVGYAVAVDHRCSNALGQRNYCGPLAYPPLRDVLLLGHGDGSFEDVSLAAGLDATYGRALGAAAFDIDGDGRLEIFVANDGSENQLWQLRAGSAGDPGLRYEDIALTWGVAVNATGQAEASMGVALGDADGDGDEDLFVSHLNRETNTLYLARPPRENADDGGFDDRSIESGLGSPSFDRTGFGTLFVDWDLDGDLDLPVVNGAVRLLADQSLEGGDFPLHQPNQLFRNRSRGGAEAGGKRFEEVRSQPWNEASEVSRALLAGDLDNDGDPDLVVTNNAGPTRLFVNRAGDGRNWIGVLPVDEQGRLVHHALAELVRPDGRRLVRRVVVEAGYAASQDPRLSFGLEDGLDTVSYLDPVSYLDTVTYDVTIRWPSAEAEVFTGLAPRQYHELRRGRGQRPEQR